MRELLTDEEYELLLLFADYDMVATKTAEAANISDRTLRRRFDGIFRKVWFNPLEFWDLHNLLNALDKEETNGRRVGQEVD